MPSRQMQAIWRWTLAAYLCIGLGLLVIALLGVWGAMREQVQMRESLLQQAMYDLRVHAAGSVQRIESQLQQRGEPVNVGYLRNETWLRELWNRTVEREAYHSFAAVVDDNRRVVVHSDADLAPRRLSRAWYESRVRNAEGEVFTTESPALTGGELARVVRLPIRVDGQEAAEYLTGLSMPEFEAALAPKLRDVRTRWTLFVGANLLVVLVAAIALFQILKRMLTLQQAMGDVQMRRIAELGQLMGGLAHEIRNPLHAIRLNLHTLAHAFPSNGQPTKLSPRDVKSILGESNQEIDRVEGLLRQLLGYTNPEAPNRERLDLASEMQAAVKMIGPLAQRENIEIDLSLPEERAYVCIDRDRLRQTMHNLLDNAREASGPNGRIGVRLERAGRWAEISIDDSGDGVGIENPSQVFEPFYSTKESRAGLGLALVKHFVEEAGGEVYVESNHPRGARFRVDLPLVNENAKELLTKD